MRAYVIAEAGVNHNGSPEAAFQLIDVAIAAGADAVKFQTFKASALVSRHAPKADYQKITTDKTESQQDMLRKLELGHDLHLELMKYCRQNGIEFLSTPFESESLDFLVRVLGLKTIKLPSGEITNAPFLLETARYGVDVILSTGMSDLAEVQDALGVLAFGYAGFTDPPSRAAFAKAWESDAGKAALADKVHLLHCTTEYPTPFDQVNLRAMDTLATAFGLPVGLSDHTPGIAVALAGVARGAVIVEKHFTLDKSLPGPDHQASLDPAELTAMIAGIRQIEAALGSDEKRMTACEESNRAVARKSLIAARSIRRGEKFSLDSLTVKRPGTGHSPMDYFDMVGRVAERDYCEDEVIE